MRNKPSSDTFEGEYGAIKMINKQDNRFMYAVEKKRPYVRSGEKRVWVSCKKSNRLLMALEVLIWGHSDYLFTQTDLRIFRRNLW